MSESLLKGRPKILNDLAQALFAAETKHLHVATDRLFLALMSLQWIGAVILTLLISPQAWQGAQASLHPHVVMAVALGGIISLGPIACILLMPGSVITRHTVAFGQMAWSGLLVHLTGGRIETHFHVFGSLAFIAFYRDWRVLITATIVTATDHAFRGIWWPQSIYGVLMSSPYRSLEHAAWVVFEDFFLIISCIRSNRDLVTMCCKQAELQMTNAEIEERVELRTAELRDARERLEMAFEEHKKAQADREQLYSQLAAASRQAGMAEVATGVLHNIGNILNSVNISIQTLEGQVRNSRVGSVAQVGQLLTSQSHDLAGFMLNDPRGQKLPHFLNRTAEILDRERQSFQTELAGLAKNIEYVKEAIATQQKIARSSCAHEPVQLVEVVEDAIRINAPSLTRHEVAIQFESQPIPEIVTDKHKVLQILVNLIKNAKQATQTRNDIDKRVHVSLDTSADGFISIVVKDNGVGIAPEHLSKICTHGFTTKKDGHGFGLHSAALDAKAMGGQLRLHSDGINQGATFTLTLPLKSTTKPTTVDEVNVSSTLTGDFSSHTPVLT